jgi:hypothetical protein
MTNLHNATKRSGLVAATPALGAGLLSSLFLIGCSDPPPPPPPPPVVVKPQAPPPPPVTPISELMAKLDIDPRVNLPEDRAPKSDPERIAVLTMFDAFARGDSARLQGMLSAPDQYELEKLVNAGTWKSATESITRIDIRCGQAPTNDKCALAVFHVNDEFEPQLWAYKIAGASTEFESVATPPNVMNSLSGEDWITAWYTLWQKDLEIASKPDEEIEIKQENRSQKEDTSSSDEEGSPSMQPAAPSGPGSPGKRPPKTDEPIRAPKPGFN